MNSQHWAELSLLISSQQKFQNLTGIISNAFSEDKKTLYFKIFLIQKGSGKIKEMHSLDGWNVTIRWISKKKKKKPVLEKDILPDPLGYYWKKGSLANTEIQRPKTWLHAPFSYFQHSEAYFAIIIAQHPKFSKQGCYQTTSNSPRNTQAEKWK